MAESVKYSVEKLNGQNYQSWSYLIKMLLVNADLWEVVSEELPSATDRTDAWKKKNDKALSTIALFVETSQLVHIRNKDYARDAWNALKEYHQKSTLSSMVFVLKQLCKLSLEEGGDMEAHISLFLDLQNKLSALGEELKDRFAAGLLLGSLPDSYSFLITALESRPDEEFTLEFVKSKLIDEYRRRRATSSAHKEDESVMKTVQKGGKSKSDNPELKTCYFCKKKGHFKKECFKYKAFKNSKEKANTVTDKSRNEDDTCFMVKTKETGIEKVCLNMGNLKDRSTSWFVDSGATSHMVNTKKFFTEFDESRGGVVHLAEKGKISEVKGIGSGNVKCLIGTDNVINLTLDNVLFVPQLDCNLVSVKKLTSAGYKVNFNGEKCDIFKDGKVKAEAKLSPELYKLTIMEHALTVSEKHFGNCQHFWHRKFGHRNIEAIKDLAEGKLATGIKMIDCGVRKTCECCIKGKITRKSFPKQSKNNTGEILELIHTDVCGPMQNVTPGNKRYILTLIDDYSRYTTVCLMTHKSETSTLIKQFVEEMKNQFGKKPKIIRSDRGGEYTSNSLRNYLKEEGIKYQYTAGYTPEQNGVAERKNRSLVEMARCMLIDANLQKKYWGEAIMTANYLQNRLPTRPKPKTPYELWHKKVPDVSNLQIFGSVAYSHIPKEQRSNKFDEKAEKLIFVGYSEESKAFRLLDVNKDRIKISRDVTFCEESSSEPSKMAVSLPEKNVQVEEEKKEQEENEEDLSIESSNGSDSSYKPSENDDKEEGNEIQNFENLRRSQRTNKGVPPDRYVATAKLTKAMEEEPRNVKEAFSRSDRDSWRNAMEDDFLITGKDIKTIDFTAKLLAQFFEIDDLGLMHQYLSIRVERNNNGIYCLDQLQYIEKILKRFDIQDAKDSAIPIDPGYYKLERCTPMKNNTWTLVSVPENRNVISCKWVFKIKRSADRSTNKNKAKRITRYLKKTKERYLILGDPENKNVFYGYADADWAENKQDRKSNSGYLFKYYGASISWACRKQTCVSLSSTEAEYIALAEACQEALWLRKLITDFEDTEKNNVNYF